MNKFDYIKFQNDLLSILTDVISNLEQKDICGFSLSSDEDARSVNASFNTKKHLLKCWEEDQDEDKQYYKWYPAEWKEEGINNDNLNQLSLELFNLKHSEEDAELTKKAILELLVDTLKKLKEKGVFDSFGNEFVLVFNVSDSDNLEDDLRWIKELNSENLFLEYKEWTETW